MPIITNNNDVLLSRWVSGDLIFYSPTLDASAVKFGQNENPMDVYLYGSTAGSHIQWDSGNDTLRFVNADMTFDSGSEVTVGGDFTVEGNTVLEGNLTVEGTTTSIDTVNTTIEDNIVIYNQGETASGVTEGTAGIQIDRGLLIDAQFLFNESTDLFQAGISGALINITLADGSVPFTGTVNGVTPVADADLATKGYVDGQDTTISGDLVAAYTAADVVVTTAFGSADNVVTAAYIAADTTISGDLVTGYTAADAVVTAAYIAADVVVSTAYGAADTTISGDLVTDYTAADAVVTAAHVAADTVVTAAYTAADTTISGDLVAQLHTRSHTITSTADHSGGNWKVIYSDGSGEWQELAMGASGTVLTSHGANIAPVFE